LALLVTRATWQARAIPEVAVEEALALFLTAIRDLLDT
jgi:hypothetical protein